MKADLRIASPMLHESYTCPLCSHPATVTDWRPRLDWITVEGCPCGGFFVEARILEGRVPGLTAADRVDFAVRVRVFRAMGHEAWWTTLDGTETGPLVIRGERPDRPT
jgi:hypothetical protein